MSLIKNAAVCLCLALVLLCAGCSSITNLTASRQYRNKNNLYVVEAAFSSNQQSLIEQSIRPKVIVGADEFPMEPVPVVTGRWQAYVPVPPDQKSVRYHFKFDYDYNSFPIHRSDSRLSQEYKLTVTDR